MKALLAILIATVTMFGAPASYAQSLEAVDKAESAVVDAWNATPIIFRRTVFVSEPPQGYGIFKERENAVFKPGEPLVVYAEPVGYAWKDNGDGTYSFGFNVDLVLKTAAGEVVAEQKDFQRLELTSRARNREFMLSLTLSIDGAPPGDYVVEYVTRDLGSDKAGTISLPFSVVE